MSTVLDRPEKSTLCRLMAEVIDAYKKNLRGPGQSARTLTIRWDADVFPSSIDPTDRYARRILDCLKYFESLTIRLRHLDKAVVEEFVKYCNTQGHSVKLVSLENSDPVSPDGRRNAKCEIFFDDFIFTFDNDNVLPTMTVKASGKWWFW